MNKDIKKVVDDIISIIEEQEETAISDRADHNGEHQQDEFLLEPSDVKENIIKEIKKKFNYDR